MNPNILNYELIESMFLAEEKVFSQLKNVVNIGTENEPAYFVDNGRRVLGVAHLDSVVYGGCKIVEPVENHLMLVSPMCDDRLGVVTLLHVLPRAGIKTDWLLTTNEETMQSTARFFTSKKQYNWLYMFDRAGSDVVTYQYEGKEWLKALRDNKFRVGQGSYSDIAELSHLGCMAVNVGTGYYQQHTKYSYAVVNEWLTQVSLFAKFYHANKDIFYEFIPAKCTKCGAILNRYDYGNFCIDCEPHFSMNDDKHYYDNFDWSKYGLVINTTNKLNYTCDICGTIQYTPEEKAFFNSHDKLCEYCHTEYYCSGCGKYPEIPHEYEQIAIYNFCTQCSQPKQEE